MTGLGSEYSTEITVSKLEKPEIYVMRSGIFTAGDSKYNSDEYSPATVSMAADSGAKIYYTTDGTEPNEKSNVYSGEFTLNKSVVIKAVAVKEGYADSDSSSKSVTVKTKPVEPESIELSHTAIEFAEIGEILKLSATVSPKGAEYKLNWYSSDDSVAEVSDNGMVTAVGEGNAEITVQAGNVTKKVFVTVEIKDESPSYEMFAFDDGSSDDDYYYDDDESYYDEEDYYDDDDSYYDEDDEKYYDYYNYDDNYDRYITVLNYYKKTWGENGVYYTLFDINGDGSEELIIGFGGSSGFSVFGVRNGSTYKYSETVGADADFYVLDDCLYAVRRSLKDVTKTYTSFDVGLEKITVSGNTIVVNTVYKIIQKVEEDDIDDDELNSAAAIPKIAEFLEEAEEIRLLPISDRAFLTGEESPFDYGFDYNENDYDEYDEDEDWSEDEDWEDDDYPYIEEDDEIISMTGEEAEYWANKDMFSDVDEDAVYREAVNCLAGKGIICGYADGTFRPDDTITRAEVAAIIVRLIGMEDSAEQGETAFTDVPADHWASGYINIAYDEGIIAGMGDGTFAPNDTVLCEQVVKMLVCVLGYESTAAEMGGYPYGYLYQASKLGITRQVGFSVGSEASRAVVARLVGNIIPLKK